MERIAVGNELAQAYLLHDWANSSNAGDLKDKSRLARCMLLCRETDIQAMCV